MGEIIKTKEIVHISVLICTIILVTISCSRSRNIQTCELGEERESLDMKALFLDSMMKPYNNMAANDTVMISTYPFIRSLRFNNDSLCGVQLMYEMKVCIGNELLGAGTNKAVRIGSPDTVLHVLEHVIEIFEDSFGKANEYTILNGRKEKAYWQINDKEITILNRTNDYSRNGIELNTISISIDNIYTKDNNE